MAQENKSTFQDFSAPKEQVRGGGRLEALRAQMKAHGLTHLCVPHADEQRNEYLPECAERLAWLSGFTGSAGEAIVTLSKAVLFVDGRYTLQAADQTDQDYWTVESLVETPPHAWLKTNLTAKDCLGIDPKLHTINEVDRLTKATEATDAEFITLEDNLVDAIWTDRPSPPNQPVHIHDFEYAGETTSQKLKKVAAALADAKADLCVLTDASSVCWLFNIRGSDVAHTPLVLAHAIVPSEGYAQLFIDGARLDMKTKAFLTQSADLHDESQLMAMLADVVAGKAVLLDPNHASFALKEEVEAAGGTVVTAKDPVALPRARKNPQESDGARTAHIRDGVAVTRFLHWLDCQKPGSVDEISAAKRLEQCRINSAGNMPLRDISFDTISGAGPNGAIVHYRVTEDTNRTLKAGELYLVDSGGQYDDGTTDITRTVPILAKDQAPQAEHIRAYTLVLKGHISLSLARFPQNTRGVDLDVLARNALWRHGLDYTHGTGHGIGSYLSVHEGPQNISRRGMEVLQPGMILSNEPGYYKTGAYGIRLENLVIVSEPLPIPGGDLNMHGFETITLAPFDTRLVDAMLLDDDELAWLNAYHDWVRRELTPLLPDDTADWLAGKTAALSKPPPATST